MAKVLVSKKFNLGNYQTYNIEMESELAKGMGTSENRVTLANNLADDIHKAFDNYKAKYKV